MSINCNMPELSGSPADEVAREPETIATRNVPDGAGDTTPPIVDWFSGGGVADLLNAETVSPGDGFV